MRNFLLSRNKQQRQQQQQPPSNSNLIHHKKAREQPPPPQPKRAAPEDETLTFSRCSCNACATFSLTQHHSEQQQQQQQQVFASSLSLRHLDDNFESFSTAIISASTALDIVKISETETAALQQNPPPPSLEQNKVDAVIDNHQPSSSQPPPLPPPLPTITNKTSAVTFTSVALGQLERKESPVFGRKSASNQKSYSLRCEKPIYEPLKLGELTQANPLLRGQQDQQDRSVATAIKMSLNGAASNGQSNGAHSLNNGAMDINRNNGFTFNGPVMSSSAEKREHLYKILVIGELGTGKTSFIKRYVHQFFSQNYRATIGVDFALKVLHWDANTIVRLQLWDIAGQERFGNMTRVYYKEAVGAFIVFDVTRSGTFDCVSKWKEDLDSKVQLPDGSPIPCILLANKCDQDKQGIVTTPEKMDEYVKENGFAGWFETSAKDNVNIDEAARALVNKILLNDKLISAADLADSERFNLNTSAEDTHAESKSKCSC